MLLAVAGLLAAAGAAQAADSLPDYAVDTFARSQLNGFGVADMGGPYIYDGPHSDFAVAAGNAWMWLRDSDPRRAVLPNAPAHDLVAGTSISLGQLPSGGTVSVGIVARGGFTDADPSYRGVVQVGPDGTAIASVKAVTGGIPRIVGDPATLPFKVLPGNVYAMRLSVQGADPTTLTLTVFPAGTDAPESQITVTDATPALQGTGLFGLRARASYGTRDLPLLVGFGPLEVSAPPGAGDDTDPPSTPAGLAVTSISGNGATVSWTPSVDNVGVSRYQVTVDGTTRQTATASLTLFDLSCATSHDVSVTAEDAAGNESGAATGSFTTASCGGDGGGVPDGALPVTDFGATPGDASDDTQAFHAALLAAAARGRVVVVPAGTYRLLNLTWVSGVEMVTQPGVTFASGGERGAVPGSLMVLDGVSNVHLRSADGGYAVFNIDAAATGGNHDDRAIAVRGVSDFSLADIEVVMNNSHTDSSAPTQSSSGIRFAPNLAVPAHDGTISHVRGVNAPYGYGTIEMNAGSDITFDDIAAEGGIALRIELMRDISGVRATDITGTNCKSALSYSVHRFRLTDAVASGVTSNSCQYGITVKSDGGAFAGDRIDGATVRGGATAQVVLPGSWPAGVSFPWSIGPSKGCTDNESHGSVPINALSCVM